jgi:hypothetical protein
MKTTDSRDPTLHWELFIRQRGSATQGVPPGKEALTWGERSGREKRNLRGASPVSIAPAKAATFLKLKLWR